jgi:hypothetical protein
MSKMIDITGQKFGRLLVVSRADNKGTRAMWNCICDCGNHKIIAGRELRNGKTISCGCFRDEKLSKVSTIHGNCTKETRREYYIWIKMIQRCYDSNNKSYKHYGARGITVCDEWIESFQTFYHDMGKRPSPDHSIDRINVNGNYEPSNCRWTTNEVQARNTRTYKSNKTGIKGVSFNKQAGKYRANISIDSKMKHLGYFETLEEAIKVRKEAEQKYWN